MAGTILLLVLERSGGKPSSRLLPLLHHTTTGTAPTGCAIFVIFPARFYGASFALTTWSSSMMANRTSSRFFVHGEDLLSTATLRQHGRHGEGTQVANCIITFGEAISARRSNRCPANASLWPQRNYTHRRSCTSRRPYYLTSITTTGHKKLLRS